MKSFRVEYLILVESDSVLCNDVASLQCLIRANSEIQISDDIITFRDIKCKFEIQSGETVNHTNKFFHLRMTYDGQTNINAFEELLRILRIIFSKATGRVPQVIWDDTSRYYAEISYPIIYEIENLMRKLITKFMLTNVGLGWIKETIPKEVADSIHNKDQTQNYLYEVDFIQLSNVLFKNYTVGNLKSIYDSIKISKDINDIKLENLKSLIPKSNWERYFKPVIECEADYLKIRWEKLYELRCKVAHNKFINNNEYIEIVKLVDEVKPILLKAIEILDQIEVAEDEREVIFENVASGINVMFEEIINSWQILQQKLYELALLSANDIEEHEKIFRFRNNLRALLNLLTKKKLLVTTSLKEQILELFKFRNIILHNSDVIFTEDVLRNKILGILDCYKQVEYLLQDYRNLIVDIYTNEVESNSFSKIDKV